MKRPRWIATDAVIGAVGGIVGTVVMERVTGILYTAREPAGFLRRRVPALSQAGGLLFGIVSALVGDELMNSVMGLTPAPNALPVEAHARGLAGHIAFSAAAEASARVIDAVIA